jgi:hypothetical protein
VGHGITLTRVLLGKIDSLWIIGLYRFFHSSVRLARKNGVPFVVKRRKAEQMLLMQHCAGNKGTKPLDGQKIRLSKSGLPVVIPPMHRHLINKGDRKVIQYWMTLFGFFRVLEYPGTPKLSTITQPGVDVSNFLPHWGYSLQVALLLLKKELKKEELLEAVLPQELVGSTKLELVKRVISLPITFFPIFKSGPTVRSVSELKKDGWYRPGKIQGETSHSWESIVLSAKLLRTSEFWEDLIAYALMTGNSWFVKAIEITCLFQLPVLLNGCEYPKYLGKLAFKEEPAGKVRVFAMLDPWTQWLMAPLHKALYALFSLIPQDGTHDQLKPLKALLIELQRRGESNLYSFDLSAATDRVPLSIQSMLLNHMVKDNFGDLWARILVARDFVLPHGVEIDGCKTLRYAVGQPMGAYSSWAMLNMSHHLIVQMAYHRAFWIDNPTCTPRHWFPLYAVLGDDVVIGDPYVAEQYLLIMKELGVDVNMTKSLVSSNGSAEFAKRYICHFADASPLSWKEYAVATQSVDVALELLSKVATWRKVTVASLLDLYGKGYRAKSRVTSHIDSLPLALQTLVLQWLVAFSGFNLETICKKTLYGASLIDISGLAIHKGLVAFVEASITNFYQRCGPRLFESNGIARIGEAFSVSKGNSPLHRFVFKLRLTAALWSDVYQASMKGLTACTELRTLLERMKIPFSNPHNPRKPYVDTGHVSKLVSLWERVEDLCALIPKDLQHRVINEKLANLSSKKVRFIQTLRRRSSTVKSNK